MSMLNESELLLHIADLAVAFAGFAGIGTALGERVNPQDRRVDAGRLTNMLVVSLGTAMLALVPFIPALFGIEESSAWRIAAISALAVVAVLLPGTAMRTKRMGRYAGFSVQGMYSISVLQPLPRPDFCLARSDSHHATRPQAMSPDWPLFCW